jgi:hypothetical protein
MSIFERGEGNHLVIALSFFHFALFMITDAWCLAAFVLLLLAKVAAALLTCLEVGLVAIKALLPTYSASLLTLNN